MFMDHIDWFFTTSLLHPPIHISASCSIWWSLNVLLLKEENKLLFTTDLGCLLLYGAFDLSAALHSADHSLPPTIYKAQWVFWCLIQLWFLSALLEGVSGDVFLWPTESTLSSTPGLCQGARLLFPAPASIHLIENNDSVYLAGEGIF